MKPRIRSSDPFTALHTLTPVVPPGLQERPKSNAGDRSVLETLHPGIAHAITLLWGHPEMTQYFAKLWMADDRQVPIHPEAMSELMLLSRVHEELLPQQPVGRGSIYGTAYVERAQPSRDVWETVAYRR